MNADLRHIVCALPPLVLQTFLENGRDLDGTSFMHTENDPFFDPPEDQHIGRSTVYLDCLLYMMPMDEWTPIIDYKVLVVTLGQTLSVHVLSGATGARWRLC
jgi:hypothetical protein